MVMLTLTMHGCLKRTNSPEQDVILSLSECLPWLQFTHRMYQRASLSDLVPELSLWIGSCDSSEPS